MYSKYGVVLIIVRACFYICVIAFFMLAAASPNEVIRGIAGGIVMADIITWFGRSIIKMDKYPAELAWEAAINIIIVAVLVYKFGIPFPAQGAGMALGLMAFLVTCGIKVFWYVAQETAGEEE
jgi:hypothetical protein